MQYLFLKPAVYLKPYPVTLEDTKAAWNNGEDFMILATGSYCSIRDIRPLKMLGEEVILVAKNGERHTL